MFDYVLFPLILPVLFAWLVVARLISLLAPLTVLPSFLLARRFYWAVPFGRHVWKQFGARGYLMKIGFEATYCMNVVRRFLTLPLRRSLPAFYICGFPKCGTTSLANHLRQHPALSGLDGMPWHDVLNKEVRPFLFFVLEGRGKGGGGACVFLRAGLPASAQHPSTHGT